MPNKKASRKKNKNNTKVSEQSEVSNVDAQQLLPDYKPIDFSAPPRHTELINKKIRGAKKKLRKINDVEKAISEGKKKITKEQQEVSTSLFCLNNKASVERSLSEYEEIRKSVENLDISAQLRLILGVFFAAANGSENLNGLASILLPPGYPPAGYDPLKELQHACTVAEQFLNGKAEELFHDPPVTFQELQAEVKEFLIPKERESEPEPEPVSQDQAPVVEEPAQEEPEPEEPAQEAVKPATETENAVAEPEKPTNPEADDQQEKMDEKTLDKSPNDQKKPSKKRGNRRGRGKFDSDRGSPKRGGKKTEKNENEKSDRERSDRGGRGGRGRGNRGRGRGGSSNRGKKKDTGDSDHSNSSTPKGKGRTGDSAAPKSSPKP